VRAYAAQSEIQPADSELVYQKVELQVNISVRQTMAEVGLVLGDSQEAATTFALSNKTLQFPAVDGWGA
jgi:hypothetical protein